MDAQLIGAEDDIVVNLVMNAIFNPDVIAGAKTLDPYELQVGGTENKDGLAFKGLFFFFRQNYLPF